MMNINNHHAYHAWCNCKARYTLATKPTPATNRRRSRLSPIRSTLSLIQSTLLPELLLLYDSIYPAVSKASRTGNKVSCQPNDCPNRWACKCDIAMFWNTWPRLVGACLCNLCPYFNGIQQCSQVTWPIARYWRHASKRFKGALQKSSLDWRNYLMAKDWN